MKGVRVVVLEFLDPVRGNPPHTPFLAVFEDVPGWEAQVAMQHGTIPSRMRATDLIGDSGVHPLDGVVNGVLVSGGWRVPLSVITKVFAESLRAEDTARCLSEALDNIPCGACGQSDKRHHCTGEP